MEVFKFCVITNSYNCVKIALYENESIVCQKYQMDRNRFLFIIDK